MDRRLSLQLPITPTMIFRFSVPLSQLSQYIAGPLKKILSIYQFLRGCIILLGQWDISNLKIDFKGLFCVPVALS